MSELAQAYVQIMPTMDGVSGQLENLLGGEADSAGKTVSSKLGTAFKTAGAVGAAAIGAAIAGLTAIGSTIANGISDVAAYGDNIDKMSQKMGMSATAYQEWDFVMQHCGTSIETMKASMKTMATAAESGSEAFDRLGISQEAIASMSQEELFAATIEALQGVSDETERTYLAGQTLGRGATELGALLNMSAEDTAAMREQVHELGGVLSDESVKAAAAFQDSLQNLQTAFSGIKNNLMAEFLPSITSIMDGITAVMTGDMSGLDDIQSGIDGFVDNLSTLGDKLIPVASTVIQSLLGTLMENAPQIIQAGLSLLDSLVQGLAENIPMIADTALSILQSLVENIVQNLPILFEAAIELIITLAEGIAEYLPELIPTIVQLIITIVMTLLDHLPELIEAALQIILALVQGIMQALPQLIAYIPEIIVGIWNALVAAVPMLIEFGKQLLATLWSGVQAVWAELCNIGKNILDGIWQGLQNAWANFKSWVMNMFSGLLSGIKSFLGIASPSKVFAEIGGFMAAGLAEGIRGGADEAIGAALDMAGEAAQTAAGAFRGISEQAEMVVAVDMGAITRAMASLRAEAAVPAALASPIAARTPTVGPDAERGARGGNTINIYFRSASASEVDYMMRRINEEFGDAL